VGVHYTSGSVSSFESIHPNFRVFELDAETLLPVRIHTYKLNDGDWFLDHTWPESLGIKDLSPSSFVSMAKDILAGNSERAIRFQNSKANGGLEKNISSCNRMCLVEIYCRIINSVYADHRVC
jgi:hypothetical protein